MSALRSTLTSTNPALISKIPGLYLSDVTIPSSPTHLKSHGITHVLSIMSSTSRPKIPMDLGIVQKFIVVEDDAQTDILVHLEEACSFIDDALLMNSTSTGTSTSTAVRSDDSMRTGSESVNVNDRNQNRVLVHCLQGISRSSSIVIAYTMRSLSLSYPAALQLVQKHRDVVLPNPGFAEQLEVWGRLGCVLFETDEEGKGKEKEGYKAWKAMREGKAGLGTEREKGRGMAALAARVGRRRMEAMEGNGM